MLVYQAVPKIYDDDDDDYDDDDNDHTVGVKYIATPKPYEFIGISIIMSGNHMNSYVFWT